MSWQAYVDTNLVGTGVICTAAILGHDGNKWASSPNFNVTQAEAKALIAGFKDSNGLRANGIHLAGTKYLFLRGDDRSIYGKKVSMMDPSCSNANRDLTDASASRPARLC